MSPRTLSIAVALPLIAALAAAPALAEPPQRAPWQHPDDAPPWEDPGYDEARPVAREEDERDDAGDDDGSAFTRAVALGLFATHWRADDYEANGLGGRLRLELVGDVGIDLHAEVLSLELDGPSRVEVPIGFTLYAPIALSEYFRLRVLGGLCAIFSLGSGGTPARRDADDIRFGFHVGGGIEVALGGHVSLFADVMYQGYLGHGYDEAQWGGGLDGALEMETSLQGLGGIALHL